ncbi:CAP domain-containing protein [Psychrobacter sp. I-STPA10]|uniref:CAP domain-containing protein n=1 Tax=Psychrobacter sp. I-STPA10 TaxID=2585769 RepID=UPI001E484E36|nr:hypothetical protein [Psychrobacter sp. I-STPA10]
MVNNIKVIGLFFLFTLTLTGCGGGDTNTGNHNSKTGTPSTGTPSTGTPSTGTPSTGTPSTGTPSTGTPSTGTPSTGTPSTGTPSTGTPSTGTPSTGTPSTGTPSTGTPSTGTPSTGTPSTGTPSTGTPSTGTPTSNLNNIIKNKKAQYQLTALNLLSINRHKCGFGGLTHDTILTQDSEKRANYIGYVLANAKIPNYNPHSEKAIAGFQSYTGKNNPYYTGNTVSDRFNKTAYYNVNNRDTILGESIAINYYSNFSSLAPTVVSDIYTSMVRQLLAAPYHLSNLVSPKFNEAGVGVSQFTPNNGNELFKFGFAINILSGAKTAIEVPDKLLTYPCDGITDSATNLRNESPNPFHGLGRDLQTNPIGQPVYVTYPTAKKIKVSNVKFTAVATNEDISVHILDADNDPNKITKSNSAFILPLTDQLKSCETNAEPGYTKGNCGLYKNSKYKVSFDVLVDGKKLKHQTLTFSTK